MAPSPSTAALISTKLPTCARGPTSAPGRSRAKGPTLAPRRTVQRSRWLKAWTTAPSSTATPGPKTTCGATVTSWPSSAAGRDAEGGGPGGGAVVGDAGGGLDGTSGTGEGAPDGPGVAGGAADDEDGGFRLSGQKVWTTNAQFSAYGLLLARTDADVPKHKGLTMFVVPMDAPGVIREKRLNKLGMHASDTALLAFNDVRVVSIEHKLGMHASPTCVLSFGDNGDCVGELIGEVGGGMRAMFTMMNNARLNVGLQGVQVAEAAPVAAAATRPVAPTAHIASPLLPPEAAWAALRADLRSWYGKAAGVIDERAASGPNELAAAIGALLAPATRHAAAGRARAAAAAWTFEDHYRALVGVFAEVRDRKRVGS